MLYLSKVTIEHAEVTLNIPRLCSIDLERINLPASSLRMGPCIFSKLHQVSALLGPFEFFEYLLTELD